MSLPRYKRVLIKISGEALAGDGKTGIDPAVLSNLAAEIQELAGMGVSVALVIGAGNFFRGAMGEELGIERYVGDYMGMLATVMNSLAMKNALDKRSVASRVMSPIAMNEIAEHYTIRSALSLLEQGTVVIAAGGTGHPYFTTDTASALRAIELKCDVMLKATRVDGVYTDDPEKNPAAEKINSIPYLDVIKNQLRVLDLTSVSLCMDNNLPIIVFDLFQKDALKKIVAGENIGTVIS
ncbi:MAG: UMP kinase [Spirochaetia bacterium]|jgi:uridylate kinase|nr:UMP kinase [Spirochaetia bacterium]